MQRGSQKPRPGVLGRRGHKTVGNADRAYHLPVDLLDHRSVGEDDADLQKTLALAAVERQYPVALYAEERLGVVAAERGYPGLDLMQGLDETGIDLRMDYVDDKHTNVHGSLKYSKVLGDYLVENYHFEDKRGRADWSDWDSAALKYTGQISGVTLPIEREHAPRTLTEVPELRTPRVDGQSIMVRWRAADAVDGYEIFRKPDASGKAAWQSVGRVGPEDLEWLDEGLSPNTKYTYTVVPYCEENGETLYGSFKFKGVSARTEK